MSLRLFLSGYQWLLAPLVDKKLLQAKKAIFRSREKILEKNFESIQFGKEGIIDLHHKPKLNAELKGQINRALKTGLASEIYLNNRTIISLMELFKEIRSQRFVNLKNIYPTSFTPEKRYFIYANDAGEYLAAVTLSQLVEKSWYIEQIARKKYASNGAMELLIYSVISKLRLEKHNSLSLGEVPFIDIKDNSIKGRVYLWIGQKLLSRHYNFEGLYYFKNKFSPTWKPIYLCGTPKISFWAVSELFFRSNLYLMVIKTIGELLSPAFFSRKIKTNKAAR